MKRGRDPRGVVVDGRRVLPPVARFTNFDTAGEFPIVVRRRPERSRRRPQTKAAWWFGHFRRSLNEPDPAFASSIGFAGEPACRGEAWTGVRIVAARPGTAGQVIG